MKTDKNETELYSRLLNMTHKNRDKMFETFLGHVPIETIDYRKGHKGQDLSQKIRDYVTGL